MDQKNTSSEKFEHIDAYLGKLHDMLWFDPFLAHRATEQARDRLYKTVKKEIAEGKTSDDAQLAAIEAFGKNKSWATAYSRYELISRFFLNLGSTFSIFIALFLVFVVLFLLPNQHPEQVPFWGAVMVFFMLYGVLTFSYLRDRLVQWLRVTLWVMSFVALLGGLYGFIEQIIAITQYKDFEGYLVAMSILLIGHAKVLLFDLWRSQRRA